MINILMLPFQSQLMQAPGLFPDRRFFFGVAGYGCVHGDTELETPNGPVKIKDFQGGLIYAYDEQQQRRVIAVASKPKAYKKVPMFKVEMSNGKCITVTAQHRFLTPGGYCSLSSFDGFYHAALNSRCLEGSTSGISRPGLLLDAPRLRKIAQDFPASCSACSHPCGEQLRAAEDTGQESVPLRTGVHVYNHTPVLNAVRCLLTFLGSNERKDADKHGSVCSRPYQPCNRAYTARSIRQPLLRALGAGCYAYVRSLVRLLRSCLSSFLFHVSKDLQDSILLLGHGWAIFQQLLLWIFGYLFLAPSVCGIPEYNHPIRPTLSRFSGQTAQAAKVVKEVLCRLRLVSDSPYETSIKKITPVGGFIYYDVHVPGYNNYFAEGIVHHNSGKSRACSMIVLYIVKQLSGKKDRNGHRPRGILAGATLGHLQKTTVKYLLEDLDNSKTTYTYDKKLSVLCIAGVDIMLVSMSVPENIRGEDAYFILADECDDIGKVTGSDNTTFEAVRALNERCRQVIPGERTAYMMMVSTSQGQKGLYRIYTSFKKNGTGFVLVRGRTIDNWYLDSSYERSMRRIYSPHEYRVYAEGEFLALSSGRVFGDFDWERNYVDYDMDRDIPSGETIYTSFDLNTGYNRGCAFRLVNGVLYAVKSYDFSDLRDAPKVLRYDFPHNRIFFIPDTTAKDQVATFVKELHRYNIHYISRSKNPLVEDSVLLVNKLLYTSRFLLCPMAKDLAEALSLEMRDKDGNIPKGKGPASPVHLTDSARWTAYFLAMTSRELNDIRQVTIARHEAIRETIEDRQELTGGYVDMTPMAG